MDLVASSNMLDQLPIMKECQVTRFNNGKLWTYREFEDSKKDGIERLWYSNGVLRVEYRYKEGKRHGLTTFWRQDGSKWSQQTYVNGVIHGTCRAWDEKGRLLWENYHVPSPDNDDKEDPNELIW